MGGWFTKKKQKKQRCNLCRNGVVSRQGSDSPAFTNMVCHNCNRKSKWSAVWKVKAVCVVRDTMPLPLIFTSAIRDSVKCVELLTCPYLVCCHDKWIDLAFDPEDFDLLDKVFYRSAIDSFHHLQHTALLVALGKCKVFGGQRPHNASLIIHLHHVPGLAPGAELNNCHSHHERRLKIELSWYGIALWFWLRKVRKYWKLLIKHAVMCFHVYCL